jgi:hypothetical protein
MKPVAASSLFTRAGNAARAVGRQVAAEVISSLVMRLALEAGTQLRVHIGRASALEDLESLRGILTPEAWAFVVDLYDVLRMHAGMSPIAASRKSTIH